MDAGICPMFAGPEYLRGNLLSLKLDEDEISVKAPISYIKKLFEWCDGTTSLPHLEVKAKSARQCRLILTTTMNANRYVPTSKASACMQPCAATLTSD
jgi:hypothetical protein